MNKVIHFEIPFDNKERAIKFYQTVFGWQLQDMPEMQYVMATTTETGEQGPKMPGAINGGLTQKSAGTPAPVVVLEVENVEEHLKKIQDNGGKVVVPTQTVMGMGLFAKVVDTEGNVIGVWQNIPQEQKAA